MKNKADPHGKGPPPTAGTGDAEKSLLRAILESPQGIIVFALDSLYRYTEFSDSHRETMKKIWGADIRPGMNMLDVISNPEDRDKARKNFDRALRGQHLVLQEEYGDSALGRNYYENHYSPMRDPDGTVSGVSVFVIDITERRQIESALRESEENMRYVVKHDPNAIAVLDCGMNYLAVSDRFLESYNVREQDILGRNHYDVFPDMPQRWKDVHRRCLAGAVERNDDDSFVRSDGSVTYNRWECRPWYKAGGRIGGMIMYTEVTTERKKAQIELQTSRMFLQAVLTSISDGVLAVDRNGRVVHNNRSFAEMWNIPPDLLAMGDDRKLLDYVKDQLVDPRKFMAKVRALYDNHLEEQEILNFKDGRIVERKSFPLLMDDSISGRVWTFRDITEQKKLEAQILRTQRMDSIGTLAAGLAHDLNNVLTPIFMSAGILRDELTPEIRESAIAAIENSARRGASLIKQVLTFARGLPGERELLQVEPLLRDMEKIMCETFPKSIAIKNATPGDVWPVSGDATQLHQVLLNLCVNARDSMPAGGTLEIGALNESLTESVYTGLQEVKPGDYVVLHVTDTGEGIPPEIIDKIFDPFFTTKETGKGTGLGLSTVLGIVRSHHGFVTTASELDRGTTFRVYLPASREGAVKPANPETTRPRKGAGETILVVDDEAIICQTTKALLEGNGYRVLTAFHGGEALELYHAHKDEIKVVLTDLMMPVMDGFELVRHLAGLNTGLKIIATTGQAMEARRGELRSLGVKVLLYKPCEPKVVLAALRNAIRQRSSGYS